MIRLNRTAGAEACAALAQTDRHGLTETDYALWHFAGIAPAKPKLPKPKRPNFKAYKSDPVIAELALMFGPKCAYCESVYGHVGPMDVEHYRPKGGYIDDKGVLREPGYYWLAATWTNLMASCPDCNRQRRQVRRANGKLVKVKMGKGNLFPIAAGSVRATGPAGITAETPLLLNPCTDFPDRHLKFRSDGFVEPADSPEELVLPKGRTTIDVCGLERDILRAQRCGHAARLTAQMQSVLVCDRHLVGAPADPLNLADLDAAQVALDGFRQPDQPFVALVAEMMLTFETVRLIARAYHQARQTWIAAPTPLTRAMLVDRVAAAALSLNRPGLDMALAQTLFAAARVAPPPA